VLTDTADAGQPILQFGTSRFLQAHVDLFVSEASLSGLALGGITVVQTTSNPSSSARLRAIARPQGFDIMVRGLVDGVPVTMHKTCRAVRAALDARSQWPLVREQMRGPVRVVVSNTGDSGWALDTADDATRLAAAAAVPVSFPAKLLVLLHDRWCADPETALTLMPCELVSRNGDQLRRIVAQLAGVWSCPTPFIGWLLDHVVWANSLVDRIVSEALEPVGAVTEPYALWAVERRPRLVLPCTHPAIMLTDDLARFERLKLFLLNLGHTLLAQEWLLGRKAADMTVLQAMSDTSMRDALESVWAYEVLPVFDALGQGDEAREYLSELRSRLLNPFLAHRLADIAQNHAQKKQRRIEPLLALAAQRVPALAQPRLRAALEATA